VAADRHRLIRIRQRLCAQVARLEQIPKADRLNPDAVVAAIAESGRPAFYEPDVAHIVERLVPLLKARDVVAVFSNGGFDGIHGKLLAALAAVES
jgi:UDP-N-acetylmuramate: L-alanyl-gamma-D-glutamyl-meso-diaminopimelate ligase